MGLTGRHTFVGFGFGAIQAGLFLFEAYRSGNFARLVVVEVLPDVVEALRQAGGMYTVNVAHFDHVKPVQIGPIEIYDPASPIDQSQIVEALVDAQEISTAIPSVTGYQSSSPGSLHRLLTQGVSLKAKRRGPPAVVYAAENHNHAAEILEAAVVGTLATAERNAVLARVQFLNTVIGKMSGVILDAETIRRHGLVTTTPHDQRAFLVEAFNRILISSIDKPAIAGGPLFQRGIEVFDEKPDLLPFEEAKLHGHNATHALGAYLGALAGVHHFFDLASLPGALPFLRAAFVQESGQALIRRYAGIDPLFTPEGYAQYADDLLARMTNPFLLDTMDRVGRDPARKLGWNDRLVGTMRLALGHGVEPRRYSFGAAAALTLMNSLMWEEVGSRPPASQPPPSWGDVGEGKLESLVSLWKESTPDPREQEAILHRIERGLRKVKAWCEGGFGDLEQVLDPMKE